MLRFTLDEFHQRGNEYISLPISLAYQSYHAAIEWAAQTGYSKPCKYLAVTNGCAVV